MTGGAGDSPLIGLFNSVGTRFDVLTPQLWGPVGHALVEAVSIRPAERVLDICSGTGASALPAARSAGPGGHVVSVDFAGELLDVARRNAVAQGLDGIEFVRADVTTLTPGVPPCAEAFDAIVCSFGVFFLPEMDDAVRRLLTLLRPGGRMGVSIWHTGSMREFSEAFFDSVTAIAGPTSHRGPRSAGAESPIARIDTEPAVSQWFTSLGARAVETSVFRLRIPCTDEFAWSMVGNSGMRGALAPLTADQVDEIRTDFLARLAERDVAEVNCDTLIAVATV